MVGLWTECVCVGLFIKGVVGGGGDEGECDVGTGDVTATSGDRGDVTDAAGDLIDTPGEVTERAGEAAGRDRESSEEESWLSVTVCDGREGLFGWLSVFLS